MSGYIDAVADIGLRVDGIPGNNTSILQPYLLGNNGRTPIFFPPGSYAFDLQQSLSPTSFTLINLGVSMCGSGHSTSFVTGPEATVPLLLLMQTIGGTTIQGIKFDRFGATQPGGSAIAIDSGPPIVSLKDIMVSGNNDIGLEVRGVSTLRADNCWFQGQIEGVRIKKQNFIGEVVLDGCIIGTNKNDPSTIGLRYEGIDSGNLLDAALRVVSCHIGASGGGRAVLAKHSTNLWLTQNVFEGNGAGAGAQVNFQNVGNSNLVNNTWSGDLPNGQDAFLVDIQEGGGTLIIGGNRILGKFKSGIVINGLGYSDLVISNNIISHSHPANFYQHYGISITDPQANHITVVGNIIRRFAVGLKIGAGASSPVYTGNDFLDNTMAVG